MIVARGIIDFVDGINHVHDVLHRYALVGTQYHSGLAVVADFGVDEVSELGLVSIGFVNEILELVVDVNRHGLLGHGLAAARRQHEFDGIRGD